MAGKATPPRKRLFATMSKSGLRGAQAAFL
jgi:hypothetical protein